MKIINFLKWESCLIHTYIYITCKQVIFYQLYLFPFPTRRGGAGGGRRGPEGGGGRIVTSINVNKSKAEEIGCLIGAL